MVFPDAPRVLYRHQSSGRGDLSASVSADFGIDTEPRQHSKSKSDRIIPSMRQSSHSNCRRDCLRNLPNHSPLICPWQAKITQFCVARSGSGVEPQPRVSCLDAVPMIGGRTFDSDRPAHSRLCSPATVRHS
jgi:hypothetical protein